jgi:hypothetical protein
MQEQGKKLTNQGVAGKYTSHDETSDNGEINIAGSSTEFRNK